MPGDDAAMAGIEAELVRRAGILARERDATDTEPRLELVAFRLAGGSYALETRYLRAVARFSEMARLPSTRAALHGVTLVRGELLTVIDLRGLLGLSEAALNDLSRIIVVGTARAEFGILADRMDGIITLKAGEVGALPTDGQWNSKVVRGITRDAVLIIDGERLLSFNFGEIHGMDS